MIIVWHYRDLRTEDHPALMYASRTEQKLLPLYIHDPSSEENWAPGGASKWWLHHSLSNLKQRYQTLESDLVIRKGNAEKVFKTLMETISLKEVCWIERHQPHLRKRDHLICRWLEEQGIRVTIFQGNYLTHPDNIVNASGTPYQVFTPFSKCIYANIDWGKPLETPQLSSVQLPASDSIESLELFPKHNWYKKIAAFWSPGREGAKGLLETFCAQAIKNYKMDRDFLAKEGTSRLSPHLAFGEISPREIWSRCQGLPGAEPFLRQLLWREFGNSFIHHVQDFPDRSWRKEFEDYPWKSTPEHLTLWQKGKTGYPIVDAGMRQLWQTGWMHNRTRMIVGSFLIKDLHIHWIEGARWFWETLVDADLGNNSLGWQWTAGSGPDAAPYFRIFNPILQGKKFDPEGEYVRTYVPELTHLPTRWIHAPWEAPESVLREAGITLGEDYPKPIVDHNTARKVALEGYETIKATKK